MWLVTKAVSSERRVELVRGEIVVVGHRDIINRVSPGRIKADLGKEKAWFCWS